jgi:hypothetical protein
VIALAALDSAEGIALLKQVEAPAQGYDNGSYAAARIVGGLVQKEEFLTAIDLADYMGAAGAYPCEGIGILFGKLPPGDERVAAVFSDALNAYTLKPSNSFGALVIRYRKELPAGMLPLAVSRILANVLSSKDDRPIEPLTWCRSKATATFTNRDDAELFDLMRLVREVDASRSNDILSTHAQLRSALRSLKALERASTMIGLHGDRGQNQRPRGPKTGNDSVEQPDADAGTD